MKTIKVEIDDTGQVTIEAIGYKGNACTKATAALEKALGKVKSSQKKPEFYQSVQQTQKIG